jgi:hypothetical protein
MKKPPEMIVPKEGKFKEAQEAMANARWYAVYGWSKAARLLVDIGWDKSLLPKRSHARYWGSKRKRLKRARKELQHMVLDEFFTYWEYENKGNQNDN